MLCLSGGGVAAAPEPLGEGSDACSPGSAGGESSAGPQGESVGEAERGDQEGRACDQSVVCLLLLEGEGPLGVEEVQQQ